MLGADRTRVALEIVVRQVRLREREVVVNVSQGSETVQKRQGRRKCRVNGPASLALCYGTAAGENQHRGWFILECIARLGIAHETLQPFRISNSLDIWEDMVRHSSSERAIQVIREPRAGRATAGGLLHSPLRDPPSTCRLERLFRKLICC